jgi:hypothetical protein
MHAQNIGFGDFITEKQKLAKGHTKPVEGDTTPVKGHKVDECGINSETDWKKAARLEAMSRTNIGDKLLRK